MIREKPFSSLQQATEWLEYLAKFKRLDQLQPLSLEMNLFQYLLLDVIIAIGGALLLVFAVLVLCIRLCLRKCRGKGRKDVKGEGKPKKGKNKKE